MIINVQNDRTNKKEPIFNLENDNDFYRHGLIYVIVLYSRALSMEEWVWAWQGKMPLCTRVTGSIRATICRTPPAHTRIGSFPGVTGAPPSPPSPLLHITSTTDTTQSETSRWSHVPHSHLRHHLKSTLKKKQNTQKKMIECKRLQQYRPVLGQPENLRFSDRVRTRVRTWPVVLSPVRPPPPNL